MIESPKVSRQVFNSFLLEDQVIFCQLINSSINKINQNENSYYMVRESLLMIEKILLLPYYEQFKEYFTNEVEDLMMTLKQLNNKNKKIVGQALNVLHFFFQDVETKAKNLRIILHNNKANFYKFFEVNDPLFVQDNELMEKKSFILYELERLDNLD